MGFAIPPEPSKDEIDMLRSSVVSKWENEGLIDTLHPLDVKRFKTEDDYLRRFLMHHDNDQKLAGEMANSTMKWRSEKKVNEITAESLDQTLLMNGTLDIHNRDVDGCKMLLFSVRFHNRGFDQEKAREILVYWIERLEREEHGKWITVFFDMSETGVKNMDMDFIQHLIHLFKDYYPWILNYIIVFEMPWLLNAMWRIIKGWLPPKSIEKIKFVDKKSIQSYVTFDQCLIIWGGKDPYEFEYSSEKTTKVPEPIMNGDIEVRKVHFAERNSVPSIENSKVSESSALKDFLTLIKFKVDPPEELVFKGSKFGKNASIILTNNFTSRYAFKIKTTSPDKYRVRPSTGVIEPDCHMEVTVTLNDQLTPNVLVRDKFLIIALPCLTESVSTNDFIQLQKNADSLDILEIRLRVGLVEEDSPPTAVAKVVPSVPPQLLTKIDNLLTNQKVFEEKMASLRRVVYVILFLMVALLFFFVMTTNNLTSSLLAQQSVASCPAKSEI